MVNRKRPRIYITLSEEAIEMLRQRAARLGLSASAYVEYLLRTTDTLGIKKIKMEEENMKKYYVVDAAREWDTQITPAEWERIYKESETEHQGTAKFDVEEAIYEVDNDDNATLVAYKLDNTWYSVPIAFADMTIKFQDA